MCKRLKMCNKIHKNARKLTQHSTLCPNVTSVNGFYLDSDKSNSLPFVFPVAEKNQET